MSRGNRLSPLSVLAWILAIIVFSCLIYKYIEHVAYGP
jgi:hypothetical protein